MKTVRRPPCSSCPVVPPLVCLGRRHSPACDRASADPAWRSYLLIEAATEPVPPPPAAGVFTPPALPVDLSGLAPCVRRETRGCCGELRIYCSLGLGVGGLVERWECDGCGKREGPTG